jgi:hypothetical protein
VKHARHTEDEGGSEVWIKMPAPGARTKRDLGRSKWPRGPGETRGDNGTEVHYQQRSRCEPHNNSSQKVRQAGTVKGAGGLGVVGQCNTSHPCFNRTILEGGVQGLSGSRLDGFETGNVVVAGRRGVFTAGTH